MKRHNRTCGWGGLCGALILCLCLTGCTAKVGQGGTTEPVTRPDLTDTREPTSAATYEVALQEAFTGATPTDASLLTYTVADGAATVTGYTGEDACLVIPDTLEDVPVTAVAEKAFEGNTTLTAMYIPDTVEVIGRGAMKGCSALTVLRTPVAVAPDEYVNEEGEMTYSFGALFGASGYGSNALAVPRTLTTLVLGDGVTEIPAYAFYSCRYLTAVAMPATLTSVGDFAFYGCEGLVLADLSETALVTLGACAFTNCAALLELSLPATVTSVGLGAVKGCGAMERMTLPFVGGSVTENTYVGYMFGAENYTLTEGYIPAALQTVELLSAMGDTLPDNAFYKCSSVKEILLPEGMTTVGRRAFYGCVRLTAIALPDSVTAVGDEAFAHCSRLQTLDVGGGLTTLGVQVFMDCLSLETVTLPSSVTTIPASCFAGCISLTAVTAPGITSAEQVGAHAYRGCTVLTEAPYLPVTTETE